MEQTQKENINTENKKKSASDSDEEEQMSEEELKLWEKINAILKEYHLTAF